MFATATDRKRRLRSKLLSHCKYLVTYLPYSTPTTLLLDLRNVLNILQSFIVVYASERCAIMRKLAFPLIKDLSPESQQWEHNGLITHAYKRIISTYYPRFRKTSGGLVEDYTSIYIHNMLLCMYSSGQPLRRDGITNKHTNFRVYYNIIRITVHHRLMILLCPSFQRLSRRNLF